MNKTFAFIRRFFIPLALVLLIVLLVLAFEGGRYSVYRAHPELSSAEQASAILAKVGALIQLPNEQPTMATINDATNAKKAQPFLQNAQNGDVLIVYPNASEALLYRPSTDKLIAVGPVDSGAASNIQQPTNNASNPVPITASSTNATTTKSNK